MIKGKAPLHWGGAWSLLFTALTQDKTSTCPQYKEEDETAAEERFVAYTELLTREAIRKKNGGWLGEAASRFSALDSSG